jgi:hypothetical protein
MRRTSIRTAAGRLLARQAEHYDTGGVLMLRLNDDRIRLVFLRSGAARGVFRLISPNRAPICQST